MKKLFLNDRFILMLIILNAVIIFTQNFNGLPDGVSSALFITDLLITFLFVTEVWVKSKTYSFKGYMSSSWNRLDFILISVSAVSLVISLFLVSFDDLAFILVLRVARVFKSFRFIRFIPDIDALLNGIRRALKASVLVIIALVIYNFMLGLISHYLFKDVAPQYFGNPLHSLYSIFRIFTVEGWFEIPDAIAQQTNAFIGAMSTVFFVLILVSGGILGLSLVNSIFVDAMVADNNDALEAKVDQLTHHIKTLSDQIEQLNSSSKH